MSKTLINRIKPKNLKLLKSIGRLADEHEVVLYLVGGIVRDLILKRENDDIDIVVEGNAIQFAKKFARMFKAEIVAYEQFGTASVLLKNDQRVDFSSSRQEVYSQPGALPKVKKGTITQDLFRRDFTINALAMSLNRNSFGIVLDLYGGEPDLLNKRIYVLHDQSFLDDPTRLLRAIRFEQRLNFRMGRPTLALFKKAMQKKYWKTVKVPRYFAEFKKILKEENPLPALYRLEDLGGLAFFGKGVKLNKRTLNRLDERLRHFRKTSVVQDHQQLWLVYFIGMFMDMPKRVQTRVVTDFPMTKSEKNCLLQCKDLSDIITALFRPKLKPADVFRIGKKLESEVFLYLYGALNSKVVKARMKRYLSHDQDVGLLITGKDVLRLGVQPRQVGYLMDEVLASKVNQKFTKKSEEIICLKKMLNEE